MSVPITAELVEWARIKAFETMRRWPLHEWDEGFGDAMVGLQIATRDFRPELGLKFETYAQWRIRGEVLDGIRRRNGIRYLSQYTAPLMSERFETLRICSRGPITNPPPSVDGN